MLETDFEVSCSVCLHPRDLVCSPVLRGRDGVSSRGDGVETSAKLVSPSPSAEGAAPSLASSSSLSASPGGSGEDTRSLTSERSQSDQEYNLKNTTPWLQVVREKKNRLADVEPAQRKFNPLCSRLAAYLRFLAAQNGWAVFLNPVLSNGSAYHPLSCSQSSIAQ